MSTVRSALPDDVAQLPVEDRIDAVCDLFEREWRQSGAPDLKPYIELSSPSERPRLFVELLLVDWEYRAARGDQPAWDDYLSRYPDFASQIETVRITHNVSLPNAAAATSPQQSGDTIDHFELHERLGDGGGGVVWKAWDRRLERFVALKIPHARLLGAEALNRFLVEAQTTAQFTHPRIVRVFGVSRNRNLAYIVSDYMPGGDLSQWLATHRPTPREAAQICRHLADALQHAHEQKVIHRDLKPGNVLLDSQGLPHIADFGLAKRTNKPGDLTKTGEILGTWAYMSPEQAAGNAGSADARTDVYALGVLLYEMLTGARPFQGDETQLPHQIRNDDPRFPRKIDKRIPRNLETICLKAMSKAPADRYRSALEMSVDLRRFLDGESILAKRAGPVKQTVHWVRRRPAMATAIGLAIMAISATAAAAKIANDRNRLLGWQTVTLATSPAGAEVVFVPLDPVSGEPNPIGIRRPTGLSPVAIDLLPGKYLVVAAMPYDRARFHEVYRTVPRANDMPSIHAHNFWKNEADGSVSLPTISIPTSVATDGMTVVDPAAAAAKAAVSGQSAAPFLMDVHEFSEEDYATAYGNPPPPDRRWKPRGRKSALYLSYDDCVRVAERVGKRLPTETEYNAACALIAAPAESANASVEIADPFGPVTQSQGDATNTSPPILGLRGNVCEWVSSINHAELKELTKEPNFLQYDYHVIRGANVWRALNSNDETENVRQPTLDRGRLADVVVHPAVGFRCVRSVSPRFLQSAE